ncbi:MAG: hypothetical protein QOI80_1342 [Solirubrobacteraceae bacterium]|jgi:hypothetical protein|nr:hypothetical protein [Solirubrobacteraceae bacterium]
MLFDLRGRGRKNTVKIVYIALAFLMGGGLVLFGIGGATNGGLVDAITGNGSGGDVGADRFKKQIADAQAKLKVNRRDEAAWTTLIRAQVSLAGTGDQYNSATNQYNAAGKDDLRAATASWKAYEAIGPKKKDEEARVASRIVQAYAALEDLPGLVGAQEIVALNRNAVGPYAALAQYAYLAGQTRKGDLAAQKAISLEDPDQREQLKGDLESYKQQGAQAAVASVTPAPATPTPTATPKGKGKSGGGKAKSGKK